MTISSVLPSSIYSYDSPTAGTGTTPVATTSDPSLVQTAVSLSANAGVVATLGGSSVATTTYNAAGLLDALVQAGNPPATSQAGSAPATQSVDQAIAASLSPAPATSGIYDASGILQATPSIDLTSNWASILKTNPELAGTVTSEAMNQAIVGTISTSA